MQVLVQHAGVVRSTDPDELWAGIEGAVATMPLDLAMPSESPEDREIFLHRFARLRESPELLRSYLALLEEVWAPVDEMWQQALPVLEEAGRSLMAQYERGRSLETLIPRGCDILDERLPEILANVEAGHPLLFVPCLFFGSSMYIEVSASSIIGVGVNQDDVSCPGPHRIGGPTAQGGGRSHPSGHPALTGERTEHRGRTGACSSVWPNPP